MKYNADQRQQKRESYWKQMQKFWIHLLIVIGDLEESVENYENSLIIIYRSFIGREKKDDDDDENKQSFVQFTTRHWRHWTMTTRTTSTAATERSSRNNMNIVYIPFSQLTSSAFLLWKIRIIMRQRAYNFLVLYVKYNSLFKKNTERKKSDEREVEEFKFIGLDH